MLLTVALMPHLFIIVKTSHIQDFVIQKFGGETFVVSVTSGPFACKFFSKKIQETVAVSANE